MTTADALAALVERAQPGELPALAGELARAHAAVLLRLAVPVPPVALGPAAEGPTKLVTVAQAAERLGVTKNWLYRHWKKVPGSKKLGWRMLRFDERMLDRWAKARATP